MVCAPEVGERRADPCAVQRSHGNQRCFGSLRVATSTMTAVDSRMPETRPPTASRPRVEIETAPSIEASSIRIRGLAVCAGEAPATTVVVCRSLAIGNAGDGSSACAQAIREHTSRIRGEPSVRARAPPPRGAWPRAWRAPRGTRCPRRHCARPARPALHRTDRQHGQWEGRTTDAAALAFEDAALAIVGIEQ